MKEPDVGNGTAVDLLENFVGIRALDLKAVMGAVDRFAVRSTIRTGVVD
jgi:hypothetical protein